MQEQNNIDKRKSPPPIIIRRDRQRLFPHPPFSYDNNLHITRYIII